MKLENILEIYVTTNNKQAYKCSYFLSLAKQNKKYTFISNFADRTTPKRLGNRFIKITEQKKWKNFAKNVAKCSQWIRIEYIISPRQYLFFPKTFRRFQFECSIIAGGLLYLFLSALFWMLLEGFQLYKMLVEVFPSSSKKCLYTFVGYGAPAFIVAAAAVYDPQSFGTKEHCW